MPDKNEEQPLYKSLANLNPNDVKDALQNMSPPRRVIQSRGSQYVFQDLAPGVSVREQFLRSDYNHYRPGEAVPTNPKEVIKLCESKYKHNGIIYNYVNLMADFTIKGFRLVHPKPRIEKFHNVWAQKTRLYSYVAQFANLLYRFSNVVVKRSVAKLDPQQKLMRQLKTFAKDAFVDPEMPSVPTETELPWYYTFFNPCQLEVAGGDMAGYSQKPIFQIKINENLARVITHPKDDAERKFVESVPQYIKDAAKRPTRLAILDPDNTFAFYYRKDDWESWAMPIYAPILSELILYDKFKLADYSALDGAISHICVWKLGSLDKDNPLIPTDAAFSRLEEQLLNAPTGGGNMHLIWGPDIDLIETSTDVHKFLGEEKYKATINAIFAGLGIPHTLLGTSGASSGMTNNYFSLKALLERLAYGREILLSWLNEELKFVQKAWGFQEPATVEFEYMNLSDDASEKALLIQLADRDLIDFETIQRRFGNNPEMAEIRLQRDMEKREDGSLPKKAGSWHNPQQDFELKKISLQTGVATPSQVGLELEEKKEGEVSLLDQKTQIEKEKMTKGVPGQGRPKLSKDSGKRKTKSVSPKTKVAANFVELAIWAKKAQAAISNLINPAFLKSTGKTNLVHLNHTEINNLENFKFAVLCKVEPLQDLSEAVLREVLNGNLSMDGEAFTIFQSLKQMQKINTLDELRQVMLYSYVMKHTKNNEVEDDDNANL